MSKTKKDLERLNESLKNLIKAAKKEIECKDKKIANLIEELKEWRTKCCDFKAELDYLEDELIENEDYIFKLQNTIVQTQINKYNKRLKK